MAIGLPVLVVLAVLYFWLFCNSWCREKKFLNQFLVAAHPTQIGSDGNKGSSGAAGVAGGDWQREDGVEGAAVTANGVRKQTYQRTSSKESSEVSRRVEE